MSAASTPSGWAAITSASTQGFWVFSQTASGTGTQSISVSGLTGISSGSGILVSFKPTGVASTALYLVQSSYQEYIHVGRLTTMTSQPYPVNPKAGNALYAWIWRDRQTNGVVTITQVTDTAGNIWKVVNAGETSDNAGWGLWKVDACKGGTTTLTAYYSGPGQQSNNFFLMEFANLPTAMQTDSLALNTSGFSQTTSAPISAGDLALSFSGGVYARTDLYASSGWTVIGNDVPACGFWQMNLNTSSGTLTMTNNGSGSVAGWGIQGSALKAVTVVPPAFWVH